MQKLYAGILNNIYRHVTCRISKDLRLVLVVICIALINGILFFDKNPGETHDITRQVIVAFLILIITVFSVNTELVPIEWSKAVYYPFVLFGLSILAISFVHRTGLQLLAVEYIFLLPSLYLVWINRGDVHILFNIISLSVVLEGFIGFIYCFCLSEQAKAFVYLDRYAGFAGGPNQFGEIGASILIAGLYLFITHRKSLAGCILSAVGIGIGISYVLVSSCRTGMVAELICILSAVIYSIKRHVLKDAFRREHLIQTVVTILLAAGIACIGLQLDNIYYKNLQKQNESVSTSESKQETISSTETTVTEEPAGEPEEDKNAVSIIDRFTFNGDLDALSSGRIGIWKLYLENSLPWGRDNYWEPGNITEETIFYYPAHNNIVEYIYRCGYLSGAIYLLLYIFIGIAGLRLLFMKKHVDYYNLFCIMCIGFFSIYSMIEWSATISRMGTCMYYFSLIPIMGKAKCPSRDS